MNHNSDVIDLVAFIPASNEVVLAIIEEHPWTESKKHLLELQTKIHNYVGFVLDGELEKKYPDYAKKPIRFELRCAEPPREKTSQFLVEIMQRLKPYGIELRVKGLKGEDHIHH